MKTKFERSYGKKIALLCMPLFLVIFIMVNMGLLYFMITMINIGISDEAIDKLPTIFMWEFWFIGFLISLFVLLQICSGYGILYAWTQTTNDLVKRELNYHKEIHGLMEESRQSDDR